jgi:hypothetical protein
MDQAGAVGTWEGEVHAEGWQDLNLGQGQGQGWPKRKYTVRWDDMM